MELEKFYANVTSPNCPVMEVEEVGSARTKKTNERVKMAKKIMVGKRWPQEKYTCLIKMSGGDLIGKDCEVKRRGTKKLRGMGGHRIRDRKIPMNCFLPRK